MALAKAIFLYIKIGSTNPGLATCDLQHQESLRLGSISINGIKSDE